MDKKKSGKKTESDIISIKESSQVLVPDHQKHRGKRRRKVKASRSSSESEKKKGLDIPGVIHVRLTSQEQAQLAVVVGEDVTPERPWKWVLRESMEALLEENGEHCGLFPIQDGILASQQYQLIVGMDKESDTGDEYYVAITEGGQLAVEAIMEKLIADQHARVINAVYKSIRAWMSQGSEKFVDASIVEESRPLMEQDSWVDAEGRAPHLVDDGPERMKYGYLSLTPGRAQFKNVVRLRYDSGAQAVLEMKSEEAQTDPSLPLNQWTQYHYEVTPEMTILSKEQEEQLSQYLGKHFPYVDKLLTYNAAFDLVADDFSRLILDDKDVEMPQNIHYREYESFIDVVTCKGRLISAIAWHPTWTGLMAVAYADNVRCNGMRKWNFDEEESLTDEVIDAVYARNMVLVWCLSDRFKPKLYLESPREVHCLAFCPYNDNILVGGLISGQVIIWDITNRINKVEFKEEITDAQQNYRYAMRAHLQWMKNTKNLALVPPAAVTSVEFSHNYCVTGVQWLSPFWQISSTGRFRPTELVQESHAMQFLSCSEDGGLYVWDLKARQSGKVGMYRPRRKRARHKPASMDEDVSEFRQLHRVLRPHFRWLVAFPDEEDDGDTPQGLHVDYDLDDTPILFPLSSMAYYHVPVEYTLERNLDEDSESMDSELGENGVIVDFTQSAVADHDDLDKDDKKKIEPKINERRMYRAVATMPTDRQPVMGIQLGVVGGSVLRVNWEGLEGNLDDAVNFETCSIASCCTVHDGPIVSMTRSPFLTDLLLTVGGRVFAIWKEGIVDKPVYWKRCRDRLTACAWSIYSPSIFTVVQINGKMSVWDLSVYSHRPILEQMISSLIVTGIVYHTLPQSEPLMAVAIHNGAVKVMVIPQQHSEYKLGADTALRSSIERELNRRAAHAEWQAAWDLRHAAALRLKKAAEEAEARRLEELEHERAQELVKRRRQQEAEFRQLMQTTLQPIGWKQRAQENWTKQQEKRMVKVLLEKKHLNRETLMQQQQPFMHILRQEHEKRRRQHARIRQKQEIFTKMTTLLFPELGLLSAEETDRPEARPRGWSGEIDGYMTMVQEQYQVLQRECLQLIRKKPYRRTFDWMQLIQSGKQRRLCIDLELNQHPRRQRAGSKLKVKGPAHVHLTSTRRSYDSQDFGAGSVVDASMSLSHTTADPSMGGTIRDKDDDEEEEQEEEEYLDDIEEEEEVEV